MPLALYMMRIACVLVYVCSCMHALSHVLRCDWMCSPTCNITHPVQVTLQLHLGALRLCSMLGVAWHTYTQYDAAEKQMVLQQHNQI
jgi:hypothetical protein